MSSKNIQSASDIRQSNEWSRYMQSIGWKVEVVGNIKMFIRPLPFSKYSFIKIEHSKGEIDFKRIDEIAKKHSSLAVVIEPHNQTVEMDIFLKNGYLDSKLFFAHSYTYKIDLTQGEKKIWETFSDNARRNIKKAQKNLIVKESFDPEGFFNLMKNLEAIKKIYTLPKKEFEKKISVFKDSSVLLFAFSNTSNMPIATLWLSVYDGVVTYMQTGINDEGYKLGANYLLVWEGMRWAKKNHIKVWDFDAVFDKRFPKQHKKWLGFSEFKSRFHGEEIEYPAPQIKIYNTFFRLIYLWSTIFIK